MSTNAPQAGPGGTGDLAHECVQMYARMLSLVADRMLVERPFTPDLAGAIEPMSQALRTVAETFTGAAEAQLAVSSEVSRAAIDETLSGAAVRDLLRTALAVGEVPRQRNALATTDVRLATGQRRIPWLEIIKEIANVVLDLLPIGGPLKGIIREILKILDKIFGGMPHEQS